MLVELTAKDDKCLWVNPEDVSAVEEKKYTHIYLKNGKTLIVKETAGEVAREINTYEQEKMMEMIKNVQM